MSEKEEVKASKFNKFDPSKFNKYDPAKFNKFDPTAYKYEDFNKEIHLIADAERKQKEIEAE